MSITLPKEMATAVQEKVRSGRYVSESEVVREGIRALMAQDAAIESWLQNRVGTAYDALQEDPDRALTMKQVRVHMAALHAEQQ